MTALATHTGVIAAGRLRALRREPAYLALTLAQPLVWLLLFGPLFERLTELPGFESTSYIDHLTPGVVVMTAVMGATWSGTSLVEDMQLGTMNRYLTSSIRRGAIVSGVVAHQAVISVLQSLIVLGVGWLLGARFAGGAIGVATVLLISMLIAGFFSAVSCTLAVLLRSNEALIGMSQMLVLPLVFLSSILMAPDLLPDWIATVSAVNPVDWAAEASRSALAPGSDTTFTAARIGFLALAWLGASGLATLAFRTYRRRI